MSIVSIKFLSFLTIFFCIYWLLPDKAKGLGILIASLLFLSTYGFDKLAFVLLYLLLIYLLGVIVKKKKVFVPCVIVSMLPLALVKYIIPFLNNYFSIFSPISILGISFLSFKAVYYLNSIYKNNLNFEDLRSFLLYFLFFPTILSGPIEDVDQFYNQISCKKSIRWEQFIKAFIIVMYGYFLKICVADRILPIVNAIYYNSEIFGFYNLFAIVLYPLYIYGDFAGYSYIALGIGEMFNYKLIQNFKQPYLSSTIKEFWHNWHASLNLWLKKFVYIPLGGSRQGKVKTYLNILIVFAISGVWHGAGAGFVVWGLLNAIYQIAEDFLEIKKSTNPLRILYVYVLISFSWMFFSEGIGKTFSILKSLTHFNFGPIEFALKLCELGNTCKSALLIVILMVSVLVIIDFIAKKNNDIATKIANSHPVIRFSFLVIVLTFILFFGKYGNGIELENFVYFKF